MNYRDYYERVLKLNEQLEVKKASSLITIIIVIVIILPAIVGGIIAFSNVLLGLTIIFGIYAILIILGLTVGKYKAVKKFIEISNGYEKFKFKDITDSKFIMDLKNESALTFIGNLDKNDLSFIYSWLYKVGAVNNQEINIYRFNGNKLKSVYTKCKFDDDFVFNCIAIKELNVNDSNIKLFSSTHFDVGARWLDDIISNG